jgi:signal transduction histidine kinase
MGQVIRNLLSNAVKYSLEESRIMVHAYQEDDEAVVCVEDEGVGIPESAQDRVFERFYRVDNEATSRTRGAGLGLAISRAIVEAHGGRIWFESVPGEGSTFYVALPLASDNENSGIREARSHDADHGRSRGLEERVDV